MINDLEVGTIILDNDKFGIIASIIESGNWSETKGFHLTKTYEIRYMDGFVSVITEKTMSHLMSTGRLTIVAQ